MPDALGSLLSLAASGHIGGHRRGVVRRVTVEEEEAVPAHVIQRILDTSGYKTTSSIEWADLDAANLSITLPNPDGWVLIFFQSVFNNSGSNTHIRLDFTIDAVRQGGAYGLLEQWANVGGERHAVSYALMAHIAGTDVVVRPQWSRSPTGTWYCFADAIYSPALFFTAELL